MAVLETLRLSFESQCFTCLPQMSYHNPDRPFLLTIKAVSKALSSRTKRVQCWHAQPRALSNTSERQTYVQASTSRREPSIVEEEEFWVYTEEEDDGSWDAADVSRRRAGRDQQEAEEELAEEERQYTEADLEAVEKEYEELLRKMQRKQSNGSDEEDEDSVGFSRTFAQEEFANDTERQRKKPSSSSERRKISFGGKQWDEPLSMTEGFRKEKAPWSGESSRDLASDDRKGPQHPRRVLSREEARKRDAELMQKRSWWGGGARGSASLWRAEEDWQKGGDLQRESHVSKQNTASAGARNGGDWGKDDGDLSPWEEREQPANTLQKEELDEIFGSLDELDNVKASTSNRNNEGVSGSLEREAHSQPQVDSFETIAGRRDEGAQGLARVSRMEAKGPSPDVHLARLPGSSDAPQAGKRKKPKPEVPEGGWTAAETEIQRRGAFAERVEHKAFTRKVSQFEKTGGRRGQPERRYGAGGDEWAAREAKWFGDDARFQAKAADRDEDEDETDRDEGVTSRSFSKEAGRLPPRASANDGLLSANQGHRTPAKQELPGWLRSKTADLDENELASREERQRRFYEQQQEMARKKEAKEYHRRGRALLLSRQGTWQKKKRRQDAKRRKKLEYMDLSEKFASEGLKLYKAPSWLDQNKGELDEEPDDLMEEIGRKLEIMGMVPPRAE